MKNTEMEYSKLLLDSPNIIKDTLKKHKGIIFNKSEKTKRIYFIGSGSSFSVAMYGAMLFNHYTDSQAFCLAPREFIELGKKESTVFLLSEGGYNVDIIAAAKKSISLDCDTMVITANTTSPLVDVVGSKNVILLSTRGEDNAFVNSQGTISSFIIMLLLLESFINENLSDKYDFVQMFEECLKQVNSYQYKKPNGRFYYLLGSSFARPMMNEGLLKINEAVQEDCCIEEIKNFTHGKHVLQYLRKENRTFVIFENLENKDLVKIMEKKLKNIFDEVIVFKSKVPHPYSTISHLFSILLFTNELCILKGISDPCKYIPPDCLIDLYKTKV